MEECVLYGNSTSNEGEGCWNLADSRYWPDIKDKRSIQSLEIFFIILYAIVLTTGLIANSLTLAVFCQLKAKLLWNNNNLLILLNLCVCDNIIVFFVAPFTLILLMSDRVFHATLYQQDNDTGTVIACNTIGFLFNYCSRAILLFLAVGAMDRFVAIFIPFKYKAIVTPIRVKVSLALCHVISLLVTVVPFMKNARYTLDMDYAACHYNFEDITKPECNGGDCNDMLAQNETPYVSNPESVGTAYFFLVFLVVIVPGLLMVLTSVAVVYRLTSRLREKEAEKKSAERGNLLRKKDTDNKRVQKVDPQEQAAITISYLVLLYIVCYLPWWVLTFETFMEYTGSVGYRSMVGGVSPSFAHYFFLYLTITTLLSSSLNPLIYFGRNRILMDKLEDIIKYKESMAKPSLRSTISAPVMSIQTF
ncbi:G-protein coupled receptor 39-like [Bolinopsis microptera]|uniref:G-protein coupled receptor 39-like n=1 Tax=Bolinopsis microptera TaxID=2820187 RepID=UPI00307AA5E9